MNTDNSDIKLALNLFKNVKSINKAIKKSLEPLQKELEDNYGLDSRIQIKNNRINLIIKNSYRNNDEMTVDNCISFYNNLYDLLGAKQINTDESHNYKQTSYVKYGLW